MKSKYKNYISKPRVLKTVLIVLSILLFFNIFTEVSFNFSYRDTTYDNMKLDFDNLSLTMEQQFQYVNFRIVEMSRWISDEVEKSISDPNFNEDKKLEMLMNSSRYMLNELNSYLETGMILYLNVDDLSGDKGFNETIIFLKKLDYLRNNAYISQRMGSEEIAKKLNLEYSTTELSNYNIEETEFYKEMKDTIAKTGSTQVDGTMNYWFRLEQGNNPDSYASVCASPIFIDGEIKGVLAFSFSDLLLSYLLEPKSHGRDTVYLFFTNSSGDIFRIDDSPNLAKAVNIGFINEEEPLTKIKSGTFNTYSQKDKLFYGFDTLFNMYTQNSLFNKNSSSIVLLTDTTPNVGKTIKIIVAAIVGLVTVIVYILDRNSNKLFNLFNKRDDFDESELSKLRELLVDSEKRDTFEDSEISKFHLFMESIEDLTATERQIFDLYCKDYSPKEVSEELNISINTVKTHNRKIHDKLGAESRADLLTLIRMMKDSK